MGGGRNRRVPVRWASVVTSAVGRAIVYNFALV